MKINIIFKTQTGSYLYGTNGENSDMDYKFIFVPTLEDLLLERAPNHINLSTSNNQEKNSKEDIDEMGWSLKKFLYGVAAGETNALDILFAGYNDQNVIFKDPIWNEILENKDKLLTKNIKAYIGFAIGQAIKYSIKGDKLLNYQNFYDELSKAIDANEKDGNGIWISLGKFIMRYNISFGEDEDYAKHDKVIGKRSKIVGMPFGDHTYYLKMNNGENFLMVSDVIFSFDETIVTSRGKVQKTINSYGARSAKAAEDKGADYKALSHGVRVLFQAEELLLTGKITFPLKEEYRNFVRAIKFKTTSMSFENIVSFIENYIERINKLIDKSNLPVKADYKWIDNFIIKVIKKFNNL